MSKLYLLEGLAYPLHSPRVILVEEKGALIGLVTVKDVLRFIAKEKPDHEPSWDERGGLDGLLEELLTWFASFRFWTKRLVGR